MVRYGYVYKTTNLLNRKVYIGQRTEKGFNLDYFGSGKHLWNSIKKYGLIHFKVEFIAFASSKKDLNKLEKFYIAEARKLLSSENVYNIRDGGEGGTGFGKNNPAYGKHWKLSQGSRDKHSIALLGNQNGKGKRSPGFGSYMIGDKNPMRNAGSLARMLEAKRKSGKGKSWRWSAESIVKRTETRKRNGWLKKQR